MAERKVQDLLKAEARVTIISPELTPALEHLKDKKQIIHRGRGFRASDLNKAFLVIAATDDEKTNLRVAEVARDNGILINIVDHPELCTFLVPSSVRRGPLHIAISTSGASPAMARAIKKDMEARYTSIFASYLSKVQVLRKQAIKMITSDNVREKFLRSIASPLAIKKLLKGKQPVLPEIPTKSKSRKN